MNLNGASNMLPAEDIVSPTSETASPMPLNGAEIKSHTVPIRAPIALNGNNTKSTTTPAIEPINLSTNINVLPMRPKVAAIPSITPTANFNGIITMDNIVLTTLNTVITPDAKFLTPSIIAGIFSIILPTYTATVSMIPGSCSPNALPKLSPPLVRLSNAPPAKPRLSIALPTDLIMVSLALLNVSDSALPVGPTFPSPTKNDVLSASKDPDNPFMIAVKTFVPFCTPSMVYPLFMSFNFFSDCSNCVMAFAMLSA